MYNLLMIEENPSQIRIMVNYIAKKFENIRICNIEYCCITIDVKQNK